MPLPSSTPSPFEGSRSPKAPRVDLVTVLRPAPPPVHTADHPTLLSCSNPSPSEHPPNHLYLLHSLTRRVGCSCGTDTARRHLATVRTMDLPWQTRCRAPQPCATLVWVRVNTTHAHGPPCTWIQAQHSMNAPTPARSTAQVRPRRRNCVPGPPRTRLYPLVDYA